MGATRTNEETVFHLFNTCLLHRAHKCLSLWFADKRRRCIITVGDAVKYILQLQELDDSLSMSDISVGEQPEFHFASVDVGQQVLELLVRLDDALKR